MVHGQAGEGEREPGVGDGGGGEELGGWELQERGEAGGGEGEEGADGPGEWGVEDEAGFAGAPGGGRGPAWVEVAEGELPSGLLPGEEVEVEVVAAGAAVQEKGGDGEQGGERDEEEGQPGGLRGEAVRGLAGGGHGLRVKQARGLERRALSRDQVGLRRVRRA